MEQIQHEENGSNTNNGGSNESTVNDYNLVEDLIFENKTINALIKGLEEDIETFKKVNEGKGSAPDIVRFTMQLNILKDKEKRNLSAINELIKKHSEVK